MRTDAPFLLVLAPVLALALGALAWRARRARVRLATAWSDALGQRARGTNRYGWMVFGVTGVLLGVGLAGPRGGRLDVDATSRALNLVIGVDLSRSMLAEDVAPNRLGRAVREARRLSQDLAQDRIGLLGFAGSSYILAPLTLDHAAVELHLTALDPDLASEGGTNLARVLRQGAEVLDGAGQGGDRALVLFTDGETHDSLSESIAAAAALREVGVTLVLVSVGDTVPVRIPLRDPGGRRIGDQQTAEGTPVETRRRDDLLRPVAEAAGGTVVSATVQNQSDVVVGILRDLARAPARERRAQDRRPLAWVTALLAALLLVPPGDGRAQFLQTDQLAVMGLAGAQGGDRGFGDGGRGVEIGIADREDDHVPAGALVGLGAVMDIPGGEALPLQAVDQRRETHATLEFLNAAQTARPRCRGQVAGSNRGTSWKMVVE